jgi:cob(I)alamin adenosyltransferase
MRTENSVFANRETGLIQIYTNPSEETNFAPFGLALRASGYGLRTLMTRFVHHSLEKGEKKAVESLAPNLIIDASALRDSGNGSGAALKAFHSAVEAAVSGTYDIVVLDGVLKLVSNGLIPLAEILKLMRNKAAQVELLLTGPEVTDEIISKAHLVTEMTVEWQPLMSPAKPFGW